MFAAATGNGKDVKADRGDVDRFRDAIAPRLEVGGAWREEMVTRYPELAGIVRTEPEPAAPLLPVGAPQTRG